MTRNKLKNLVAESYKNDILDSNKVYAIVNCFTRFELKQYIDALKNYEDKKNIIVTTPFKAYSNIGFEKLFPNKKIVYKIDPSLMLGVKIVDNDNVYEFNLKSRLDDIISYVTGS
ncbi:MAG: hypothetical protein AAB600_03440 [Patescibacteria group bacterium]